MSSPSKRDGDEEEDETSTENKKKRKSYPGYSQSWKFWFLSKYEFYDTAVTFTEDILKLSLEHKESEQLTDALTKVALGACIADVFGGNVKRVHRSQRGHRRSAYSNLRLRNPSLTENISVPCTSLLGLLKGLKLPKGWYFETYHQDKITFFCRQKHEFDKQRITLELDVEISKEHPSPTYTMKSRSHQADLGTLVNLPRLDYLRAPLATREQISCVIGFLDNSGLCLGVPLNEGEDITALIDHTTGKLIDVTDPEKKVETRSFSSACLILTIGSTIEYCANCRHLKAVDCRKKLRNENRTSINNNCNWRYLSREELVQVLEEEKKLRRKAELRAKYWQTKYESDVLATENEDHESDPDSMTSDVDNELPSMVCTWENGLKLKFKASNEQENNV